MTTSRIDALNATSQVAPSWLTLANVLRLDAATCVALGVLLVAAPAAWLKDGGARQ